jgi:aryl-alcohol dehydrogenase-like predicted oxidoreductase
LARTGKCADIFLATKFGFVLRGDTYVIDGSPEHMHKQIANSLKSLQTDYVDLYYLHRPDIHTPIEVTVRAMAELVKSVMTFFP